MKTLKFRGSLKESILKKEKDTTWRLFDDKDINEGDDVELIIWESGKKFATAKIIRIKEVLFENLTIEDKMGHEKFASDKEMYETYSRYYNKEITPKDKLKIIKFKLSD